MPIVLDAMGSDSYPDPELQAAVDAAELLKEEIILTGNQGLIETKLKTLNVNNLPITIHHAPDVLEMGDKAVASAMKKPNNSMAIGMGIVKNGGAQAFVTAGNTGAAFFSAVQTLKRLPGISRPALTTPIPTKNGRFVFLDTGANADCRPEFLVEFAVMGSVYAEKVLGINNPRVGLLSNGEEAGKGNQLVKDAFPILEKSGLNFIGNIEPKEAYEGHVDVVVADGFTGNVFIKTSEAVAKLITDILREEISASFSRKIGYLLVKPGFRKLKSLLDPGEVGAAILLGVNGLVFIGHGRSDARALTSAIRLAQQAVKANLLDALRSAIQDKLANI